MGNKGSLFETKKAQIVILHKEGFSQRKICNKVFFSKMTVHQASPRFQNVGLYYDKKRSGRLRKTSLCDNNFIWQIAAWYPTSFCKKICAVLLFKGTDIYCTTVSGRLVHNFNLKVSKPQKNLA